MKHREKRLSATKVLFDKDRVVAGFYTLATGQTFAFVAVILDCVDDRAKAFYQRWDFAQLPGNPYRLFLSSQTLAAMMKSPAR